MKIHLKTIFKRGILDKSILYNFSHLTIFNALNAVIPILVLPYLIRVLGVEKYGVVIFAQAVVSYLVIIVSFGFNLYATKLISENRESNSKIEEIFNSVIIIKGCLVLLSFLVLLVLVNFIPSWNENKWVFYFTIYLCIHEWLFPIWYYQGIENMKHIVIINLINKLIFIFLMIFMITDSSHFVRVPIFYLIGSIVGLLYSYWITHKRHNLKFKIITDNVLIKKYISNAFQYFITAFSISIYSKANRVLAGIVLGVNYVTYVDIVEKMIDVLKLPQTIIIQSFFPSLSKHKSIRQFKRMVIICAVVSMISFFSIFFGVDLVVLILEKVTSKMLSPIKTIVLFWIFLIPITSLNTCLHTGYLIPWGHIKSSRNIIFKSLIVFGSLIIAGIALKLYNLYAILMLPLLCEGFVLVYSITKINLKIKLYE